MVRRFEGSLAVQEDSIGKGDHGLNGLVGGSGVAAEVDGEDGLVGIIRVAVDKGRVAANDGVLVVRNGRDAVQLGGRKGGYHLGFGLASRGVH